MKQLLALPLLCTAFSVCAYGSDFLAHLGMDAQGRSIPFEKGLGDNLVKKNYLQNGIYTGFRFFDDTLGVEAGYQRVNSMARKQDLSSTDSYFSSVPTVAGVVGASYVANTKVCLQNFYGSFVGLVPLVDRYRLKLIISVGAGRARMKTVANLDAVNAGAVAGSAQLLTFMRIKWIPKIGLGLQHRVNDHLGLRLLAGWEQTSQFKRIRGVYADGSLNNRYFATLKDSMSLGLGLFYSF